MVTLKPTADGSSTFFNDEIGEHYHSIHGAVQESKHVFIQEGLAFYLKNNPNTTTINIFEIGFGTGLNFLLSTEYCFSRGIQLNYTGIEAYPLSPSQIQQTNYHEHLDQALFQAFCKAYPNILDFKTPFNWEGNILTVVQEKVQDVLVSEAYNLVYFDAFAPLHQAEMWDEAVLNKCAEALKTSGIFVTYSITGKVKRFFAGLDFVVQKPAGANYKREMFRAIKHV